MTCAAKRSKMILLFLCGLLGVASAQRELETYRIIPGSITVSGLNSGAAFAIQLQTAYSTEINGVGSYAGAGYHCAAGTTGGRNSCRLAEGTTGSQMYATAVAFAADREIDDTIYMRNATAWLYHGELDTSVHFAVMNRTAEYIWNAMKPTEIKLETLSSHGHGFPTLSNGKPCEDQDTYLPISACGYDGAYEMLNFTYKNLMMGDLEVPVGGELDGDLYQFNQGDFLTGNGYSLSNSGWMFVPLDCYTRNKECPLHVHFHPCLLGSGGDYKMTPYEYMTQTGLNDMANVNDIIMLHPTVDASQIQPTGNEDGCWDWWGYNDGVMEFEKYAKHEGEQMEAVMKMIRHIRDPPPSP